MTVIFLLIPLSIAFAAAFLAAFIWAVRSGQYDDTCTPAMRLLVDDHQVQTGASGDCPEAVADRNKPSPRPSPFRKGRGRILPGPETAFPNQNSN